MKGRFVDDILRYIKETESLTLNRSPHPYGYHADSCLERLPTKWFKYFIVFRSKGLTTFAHVRSLFYADPCVRGHRMLLAT